jgi:hypothetical protein
VDVGVTALADRHEEFLGAKTPPDTPPFVVNLGRLLSAKTAERELF